MIRRIFAILFCALSVNGATYYVATNGSDSANGSQSTPWLTQQHAWDTMAAGDTTIVQPGSYTRTGYDTTTAGGTPSARITMKAATAGTVTNRYGISIRHSWITYDGFTYYGTNLQTSGTWNVESFGAVDSGAWVVARGNPSTGDNPTNVWLQNLTFLRVSNTACMAMVGHASTTASDYTHVNGGQSCVISNCVIRDTDVSNYGPIVNPGYGNLLVNCTISNILANWAVMFQGLSNTVRGCTIDGVAGAVHPDAFQTYMTGGSDLTYNFEAYGMTIENNIIQNVPGGLCQFELYPNPAHSIPPFGSFLFRNNVITNVLACSIDIQGMSFINNVFDNCPLNFVLYNPSCWSRMDQFEFPGAATNTTILNNLFIDSPGPGFQIDTNWSAGPWNLTVDYNCYLSRSGGSWAAGVSAAATNSNYNTFPQNVNGCMPGLQAGYWTITGKQGAHDINTGADPKLEGGFGPTAYRPMLTSPLISAGTNFLATDYEVVSRSTTPTIGAFEFDPALKLHFDFDGAFVSAGYIEDVTGNGHRGWQYDSTNWFHSTPGIGGNALQGYTNGTILGGDSATYTKAQYAAITNITGLDFLTNGTVALWVRWATNAERRDRILDCGFAPVYSLNGALATNSWMLQYGSASTSYDPTCTGPSWYVWTGGDSNSTNSMLFYWTNQPRDGVTWQHMAISWQGGSNFVAYQNGQIVGSNAFPNPFLRIDGATSQPWLALGAYQHEEPPQNLGSPYYLDTGFWKSTMDDLRIYNRALAPAEVANLYAGAGAAVSATSSGGTAPTITVQPQSQSVTAPATATFSVTATGDAPLAYQWTRAGTNVTGATASSYTTPATAIGDNGQVFFVTVTNASGSVQSDNATLTVGAASVTNFYVATTGDDSNDGSSGSPFLTVPKGIASASAAGGGTVNVASGTYLIDAVNSPVFLSNNVALIMASGAVLHATTNSAGTYGIVYVAHATNVLVAGGTLQGERYGHTGVTGEWGMGLYIKGAADLVVSNVLSKECWGDGFYIGNDTSKNVLLTGCTADLNRRQGLSIEPCVNVTVTNCVFKNTQGTNPESGVDIEPYGGQVASGVTIANCIISNNAGGGLYLDPNWASGYATATNCVISGNTIVSNGWGGVVSTRPGIKVAQCQSNIVSGNFIDQQNGMGIVFDDAEAITMTNNRVTRTVTGGAVYSGAGDACDIWNTTNCTFSYNTLTNNSARGLYLTSNVNLITNGNVVADNNLGDPFIPTNFFVSSTGNSGNSGLSAGSPWNLIYALRHIGDSNSITLASGIYSEGAYVVTNHWVTLISSNKWMACISNSPSIGLQIQDGINGVTVDGLQICSNGTDGLKFCGTNVMVRNCWIHDNLDQGLAAHQLTNYPVQGFIIEKNLLERNGSAAGAVSADHDHGLYVGGQNGTVRNNVARQNTGYGLQFFPEDGMTNSGIQCYQNLVYSNDTAQIFGGGIVCYANAHSNVVATNFFYANTVYEPSTSDGCLKISHGTACITNNIFHGNILIQSAGGGETILNDYNLADTAISPSATHNVNTALGLVNPTSSLFWPAIASGSRGVALSGVFGPVDFFGVAQSSAPDVGFVQYTSGLAGDLRNLSVVGSDFWGQPSSAAPPTAGTITTKNVGTLILR